MRQVAVWPDAETSKPVGVDRHPPSPYLPCPSRIEISFVNQTSRGIENRCEAISLYDTTNGQRHQVTSGSYDSALPSFDPEGKYLYYLSNRTYHPYYSDQGDSWIYANTTQVVAVPLRRDVASPLATRSTRRRIRGPRFKDWPIRRSG